MGYINPRIHLKATREGLGYNYKKLWTDRNNLADEYKKINELKVDLILVSKELNLDTTEFDEVFKLIDSKIIEIDKELTKIHNEIKKYNEMFNETDTSNDIALSSLKRLTMDGNRDDDIIVLINKIIDNKEVDNETYREMISMGFSRKRKNN